MVVKCWRDSRRLIRRVARVFLNGRALPLNTVDWFDTRRGRVGGVRRNASGVLMMAPNGRDLWRWEARGHVRAILSR